MSVSSYAELRSHLGHSTQVSTYGGDANVAIECLDCDTILLDFDAVEPRDEVSLSVTPAELETLRDRLYDELDRLREMDATAERDDAIAFTNRLVDKIQAVMPDPTPEPDLEPTPGALGQLPRVRQCGVCGAYDGEHDWEVHTAEMRAQS